MVSSSFEITKAVELDKPALFAMFMEVVRNGEAFMHDDATTYEEWELFWFGDDAATYVVKFEDICIASYKLKPNQPGRGRHIANGGYMVHTAYKGKGIGKLIGQHSIQQAKMLGYEGLQFNAVVSTNLGAVKLWESLGFRIVGTNPNAFNHKLLGKVDTYTMFLDLT